MRIGVLSDTHDELESLNTALDRLRAAGVSTLLHCGDVCGADVVWAMEEFDVTFARGNMDRDPALDAAIQACHGAGRLAHSHRLVLDGLTVALLHGHQEELMQQLIGSGRYAYVFHGHTHRRADRQIGATRVINPGALGGTRREPRSLCIVDLESGATEFKISERGE